MGNVWHEYKLRKFFDQCKKEQFKHQTSLPDGLGKIYTVTDDFNRVFQLSHLMHHFFFEGIGLRQMIDYYYLLLRGFSEKERKETLHVLKDVGDVQIYSSCNVCNERDIWFTRQVFTLGA